MALKTHGNRNHPLYQTWIDIRRRCNNPKRPEYRNYGARGIQICERWNNSFHAFLEDMGEKPSSRHSIDRINNDGDYEPANCRWATVSEQHNNTRRNVIVIGGLNIRQAAKTLGISEHAIVKRHRNGRQIDAERNAFIRRGECVSSAKLTTELVSEIRAGYAVAIKKREFANRMASTLGVHAGSIWNAILRKTWKHVP